MSQTSEPTQLQSSDIPETALQLPDFLIRRPKVSLSPIVPTDSLSHKFKWRLLSLSSLATLRFVSALVFVSFFILLAAQLSRSGSSLRAELGRGGELAVLEVDALTKHVLDERFYRRVDGQSAIVQRTSKMLPDRLGSGRTFSNLWEMLGFLVFMHERDIEYRVLQAAFDLRELPNLRCDDPSCQPGDSQNINTQNLWFYLEYLRATVGDDLRAALYQERLVEARRLAHILDQRLRLIDVGASNMTAGVGVMNRLVLYNLLATSLADLDYERGHAAAWVALVDADLNSEDVSTLPQGDHEFANYILGIKAFRSLCFVDGKPIFDALLASKNPDMVDAAALMQARMLFHSSLRHKLAYKQQDLTGPCQSASFLDVTPKAAIAGIHDLRRLVKRKGFRTDLGDYALSLEAAESK